MEFMPNFTLHRPTAIEDAVKLRAEAEGARFVAGGTDMIVNVRRGIEQPEALIVLSAIEELKSITEDNDGLHIGAGVTLNTVATDPRVLKKPGKAYKMSRAAIGLFSGQGQDIGLSMALHFAFDVVLSDVGEEMLRK